MPRPRAAPPAPTPCRARAGGRPRPAPPPRRWVRHGVRLRLEGAGSNPSIPAPFLSELKARCTPGDFNTCVPLDRGSEGSFDDSIYRNIRAGLVPIASDAALEANNTTTALVAAYLGAAAPSFVQDFVGAMLKMGTIGAITGDAIVFFS
ncbi:hypothetical protein ACQ4PT_003357 [Festuca glaucescens]